MWGGDPGTEWTKCRMGGRSRGVDSERGEGSRGEMWPDSESATGKRCIFHTERCFLVPLEKSPILPVLKYH